MGLQNGTSLGPYEIIAPLGAGGMGEVYRARDTRLDRIVAIKILPATLAKTPAVRARFEREARAISAITHPHICALYDVGSVDGTEYLVMEYLEGESLAARLARGPLPLSQLLRYGAEIAQALHHAHRRGITHRDLKPGNVMLTAGGAKLLDFGLAKLVEQQQPSSASAATRVSPEPLTTDGMIVGTLPYMSPEQVEGRELDARSDIFSLGAMLYEMSTGHRPFQGNSSAALMASILSSDPPPDPAAPPALDRVIRTALEKNPDDRWQTAHDLARQLRWLGEGSSSQTHPAHIAPKRLRSLPLIGALLLTAAVFAIAGWLAARRTAQAPQQTMRLSFAAPAGVEPANHPEEKTLAISPDGRSVVFVGRRGNERALYLRALDAAEAQKIEGTEAGSSPFWSSDGQWIGFIARGKMWKRRLAGGVAEPICDSYGAVASWLGDTILFADDPGARPAIFRISANGGTPAAVTALDAAQHELRHTYPHLLPDGKHFLYMAVAEPVEYRLMLGSLDSPERVRIATNVSGAVASGTRLFFVREASLFAQEFDLEHGLRGEPVPVAENVAYFLPTARADFDVSRNGVVAYMSSTAHGRLAVRNRQGADVRVLDADGLFFHLDVAPDGRRAAVTVRARETGLLDIWIYDLARAVRDRFTTDPGVETDPVWSPDGRTIAYSAAIGRAPRLVQRRLSAPMASPVEGPGVFQIASSYAPDGKSLYYMARTEKRALVRLTVDGTNRAEAVVENMGGVGEAQASLDGKWLAFQSTATGNSEVYVQNLESGERMRISTRGGLTPRWRADGKELFYLTLDNTVVSATPRSGGWDDPQLTELFHVAAAVDGFDVLPDGQQFVIAESTASPGDSLIHIRTVAP